jgi:hypothetical protein
MNKFGGVLLLFLGAVFAMLGVLQIVGLALEMPDALPNGIGYVFGLFGGRIGLTLLCGVLAFLGFWQGIKNFRAL